MGKKPSPRGHDPSPLSRETSRLGKKIEKLCLDCGDEFEAVDLGIGTRKYCNKCADKNILQEEEDEKTKQAEQCEERYRELIRFAQIPPKWKDVTFANSNPNLNPRASRIARKYAEKLGADSPSLIFYSPGNGTGKTHLSACIANHVLHELRYPVLFKKARDLMLEIRRTFADRDEITEADILDRVLSTQLLVLDDVGVDPPSQWIRGTYWTVFDRRLEWQLPVIVTTNRPIEAEGNEETLADRIGEGAVSRLIELCQGNVIDMTGEDLR